jgi:hypothetical protein
MTNDSRGIAGMVKIVVVCCKQQTQIQGAHPKHPEESSPRRQCFRGQIAIPLPQVESMHSMAHWKKVPGCPALKKLKCLVGEDEVEEVLSHNEVLQHVEKVDDDGKTFWKCNRKKAL